MQKEGITSEEIDKKVTNKANNSNIQEMALENLENYTETQYNNFVWVRYNDVLSVAEYETLISRYADYKHNKNHYPTTRFGEAVIYSFDYPDILMYVKGAIRSPQIAKVVIIDFELPLITQETIQKEISSNERNQLSFPYKTVTDFFGKGCFTINKKRDFPSFQEYRRKEGELSREDNPSHRIKQDGARNVEKSESFDKSEHIKNSIKINAILPSKEISPGSYVPIGVVNNTNGYLYIVRSVVNQFKHKTRQKQSRNSRN